MIPEVWSLVLAAGAGRRLAPLTGGIPKQFWRARGRRSLLGDTLARLESVSPPSRTVVVVDRAHRPFLQGTPPGITVLYQPADRGTAVGVLLGLMPILEHSPDGIVVISPADHGFGDTRRFRLDLRRVIDHVRSRPRGPVLFGVEPSRPNEDYGWIVPERRRTGTTWPVAAFIEKPPRDVAVRLLATGALWNTMLIVVAAKTLFELYQQHLPGLATVFREALEIPVPDRETFLELQYPALPARDFSRDLFGQATNLETFAWPASVGWCDLGTPERLQRWVDRRKQSAERRPQAVPAA